MWPAGDWWQVVSGTVLPSHLNDYQTNTLSICNVYYILRIFVPKWNEVTEERRNLHIEELNDSYCLPNIVWVIKSRTMRWDGHLARMGEGRGVYRVLVGKPEGMRPLGRPRRRWEDNIKMDFLCFADRATQYIYLSN